MMYKSQIRKMDPYDWFCGPGSHITIENIMILYFCSYQSSKSVDNVKATSVHLIQKQRTASSY